MTNRRILSLTLALTASVAFAGKEIEILGWRGVRAAEAAIDRAHAAWTSG